MSTFLTLAVICAFCFAFRPLHVYGVALLAFVLLAYPTPGFLLLIFSVITYVYFTRKNL